jgi:hypothetical protein
MPSLRQRLFFFFGSNKEDVIAEYVIREHRGGRTLEDILKDPHVTNTLTPEQIPRLFDRPELVQAVGEDVIAAQLPGRS